MHIAKEVNTGSGGVSVPSKQEKNPDWSSVLIKTDSGDGKPTYF